MISHQITPQTPVSEIFERLPEAAALFVTEGTDCVGCAMEQFCTLEEVALHYALEVEVLIHKLEALGEGLPRINTDE